MLRAAERTPIDPSPGDAATIDIVDGLFSVALLLGPLLGLCALIDDLKLALIIGKHPCSAEILACKSRPPSDPELRRWP